MWLGNGSWNPDMDWLSTSELGHDLIHGRFEGQAALAKYSEANLRLSTETLCRNLPSRSSGLLYS